MLAILERVMPYGPVFFGVLIFAPVLAAVMDAVGVSLPGGVSNLTLTLPLGLAWSLLAKSRGRWL